MKRRLLTLALAIPVLSATAAGYALFGPKWAVAQVPYYINPDNGDGIPAADVIADIQAAGMNWTAQSNAAISLYYMGQTSGATASMNGKNEMFFRNASKDAAAATTYWWSDSSNRMIEADVVVWDATYTFVASNAPCSGSLYVQDIFTHEFGHALGLAHSSVASATMYPVISRCSAAMRSLDADDLAGIEKLYPAAGANAAPSVNINSPANGAGVNEGTAMTFTGSATDPEDGNIGSSMKWTSSVNGQIGTGTSFSRALSAGTHTITASATDSRGASSTRQVTVYVTSATQPPPSSSISLSASKHKVRGLQRVDLRWSGAATSTVNVIRDGVNVLTVPNSGSATDAINAKGSGTYTYRVCEVGTSVCSNSVVVSF